MLSSTARPLVARVARRAVIVGQPARCSSQLTTTPSDGAGSKEEERPTQHDAAKPIIFDLKVETPINKSSEWNISFAPEQAGDSPVRGQSMHGWRNSRSPPRGATTAGRPIRLPMPSNQFSSLAIDRKPLAQTEPFFGSDRRADNIDEVPPMEMLGKLYADAEEKPAKMLSSATYFPGTGGTHFLPSLDKLPDDIYFRISNKARLRVGMEAGIKRTRDHEQPRIALPPSATSGATPYSYYYP
ncbi:hypothetical protein V8F33_002576 [Rhypophila sp. PSN 637]